MGIVPNDRVSTEGRQLQAEGEAAAHYMLGTVAIHEGDNLRALKELLDALRIRQKMEDILGESTVWYQLGAVAIQLGRILEGARLVGLAYILRSTLAPSRAFRTLENMKFLAPQLQFDERQFDALLSEVADAFAHDHGESLLRSAFHRELQIQSGHSSGN